MGERTRRVTLEHVVIAAIVAIGVGATAGGVSDNSMLLHLRTGIDIFDSHSIPRHDPYSYTAGGQPWVVQSWFAEWTYGALHALGGLRLVILEQMLLSGLIAFVIVTLARAGTMVRTTVAVASPIAIAVIGFAQRPLLFALLCFALVVLIVTKGYSRWLLIPIGWVWVNSHGSFPVGLGWLVLTTLGGLIDTRRIDRRLVGYLGALLAGVIVGALNPLGPKLLIFWTRAFGDRSDVFGSIIEWSSPDFRSGTGPVVLVAIVLAVALCIRQRPPWRYGLPVLVLLGASLYSARYLGVFAISLCPALAEALVRRESSTSTTSKADDSQRVAVIAMALVLLVVVAMVGRTYTSKPTSLKEYPVAAVAWMKEQGLLSAEHRVAQQDFVGCYLIYESGGATKVFIDDRFDMYPASVSNDYLGVSRGTKNVASILNQYRVDVVLWHENTPPAQILALDREWTPAWRDDKWVVFTRTLG